MFVYLAGFLWYFHVCMLSLRPGLYYRCETFRLCCRCHAVWWSACNSSRLNISTMTEGWSQLAWRSLLVACELFLKVCVFPSLMSQRDGAGVRICSTQNPCQALIWLMSSRRNEKTTVCGFRWSREAQLLLCKHSFIPPPAACLLQLLVLQVHDWAPVRQASCLPLLLAVMLGWL